MTIEEEFFEFVKQHFPHDDIRFEQCIGPNDFVPRYKIFFNEKEVSGLRISTDALECINELSLYGQSKKSLFTTLVKMLELEILKSL